MKLFSVLCSAILLTPMMIYAMPGAHTDMCLSNLQSNGSGTFDVFDGDWSGLEQTAIVPASVTAGESNGSTVVFVATPAKPEWGVEAGCTVYYGQFDGRTFTVTDGHRPNETVTYTVRSPSTIRGELSAPGVENSAVMHRVGRLQVR